MARAIAEKCRRCSKLPVDQAKLKECWVGQRCHVRRSSYKHRDRYNRNKKRKYQLQTGKLIPEVTVEAPIKPAAIRRMYRARRDAPLHAMSAELWIGQKRVAFVEPVHTLGWTNSDVTKYSRNILNRFSEHLDGKVLHQFDSQVEVDPSQCPIRPCPLFP
ncbi:hypothetical protein [Acaryochloris marina]|uniref:hypothetical protein n=1 Tax=Acaryochloris marina TaxID=155978 RepID=UPI0021C4ACB3|nr:hypothetical protein [Acaryochloris marina]